MTELDQIISAAFSSEGQQQEVNKVYLTLLQANLYLPVKKETFTAEGNFDSLFAKIEGRYFMWAFDTFERLTSWAGEQFESIHYVQLSGQELILGINEQVFLCLNIGTPYYKEFSPEEIARLKMIASRIAALKGPKEG